MDISDIERQLQGQRSKEETLNKAARAIEEQLNNVRQEIAALDTLLSLRRRESDIRAPIADVLSAFGPHPDESPAKPAEQPSPAERAEAEAASPSKPRDARAYPNAKTIGKRIYAAVIDFLNRPLRQIAHVHLLYTSLPDALREELEAIPADNAPEFRFRRMLRANKIDFSVDRYSGFVTYLRYHPGPDFARDFPAPPTSPPETVGYEIVARRFDEHAATWSYHYKMRDGSIREAPLPSFIAAMLGPNQATVGVRNGDGALANLAVIEVGGEQRLASYANGRWTPDFDYRVPITEAVAPSR